MIGSVPGPVSSRVVVRRFARLRWQMLRGALRSPGAQRWTVLIGLVASVFAGVFGGLALAVAGQVADDPDAMFVIAPTALAAFVVAIGVIAGVSQPIDPRVLAMEPLTDRQLATGLLVASALGPPGLAGALLGLGLFAGAIRDVDSVPLVLVSTAFVMATLLLISRSTINALGLFVTRFPRAGQIVVGVTSLVVYGGFQFVPQVAGGLDANEQRELADVLRYTPPGQLGEALVDASSDPAASIAHLAVGAIWLVPLAALFVWSTRRLITSVKRFDVAGADDEARAHPRSRPVRSVFRRLCGGGATGVVAWRGVLTRLRTPRSALETFTGAGVGLAIVLVPALLREGVGAGAVLVGGAVQFAVLFMAGNSFGSDGPALSNELLCGVDPALLVRAKARSVVVVASPIAVIGPVVAAAVTGEWRFLVAGFLVGIGGLLAGAGGAIVQSVYVPIAIPEGDNPLAGGDTGKGCLSGLMLAAVILSLAVVTLPLALALLWAVDRGSWPLVTLLSAATVAAGALVYHTGIRVAAGHWRSREPELYAAVVPTR